VVAVSVGSGSDVLAVAVLAASLYGMYFLREPAFALLAYVATRPIVDSFVSLPIGPVSAGQVWGAGLLIVLVAFIVRGAYLSRDRSRIPIVVVALVAAYAGLAVRGSPEIAAEYGPKLTAWLLLIVAVEWIARSAHGQEVCFRAGYAIALGTAVAIGVAIARGRYGANFYESFALDIEQGPHGFAFLALMGIAFPMIALLQRRAYALSLGLVGILAVEITLSYVRTALIALAVVVLSYVFIAGRRRSLSAFVLAGAAVGAALVVQDRLAERFADLKLLTSGDASLAGSGRIAIWTAVWDGTVSSMSTILTGAGAGASNLLVQESTGMFVYAHNDPLEFFATGGLLLLAVYGVFLVWALRSARTLHRDTRQSSSARVVGAIALGVVGAFIVVSVLNSMVFYAAAVEFAILLGLVRGMTATPGATFVDARRVLRPYR
jgi:hypothetical protein